MRTYGTLKAFLSAYAYDRRDLLPNIPGLIDLSEQRIFRYLRCGANERVHNIPQQAEDNFLIPRDYLEMKLFVANRVPLTLITPTEYLSRERVSGQPKYFCKMGDRLYLHPSPDSPVDITLFYWQDLSGQFSADDDTNEVLRTASNLYVYGGMLELMPYLAQDERISTFNDLFNQALAQLNTQTVEAEYSGSVVSVSTPYPDGGR